MTVVGTSVEGPPGAGSEHIRRIRGDLLACDEVDAIVNAVNCVGVMGKGIALQFKCRWPTNFIEYASACKAGAVRPGKMLVHHLDGFLLPRYIVNFPTKAHWREPSRIEFVRDGLGAWSHRFRTCKSGRLLFLRSGVATAGSTGEMFGR